MKPMNDRKMDMKRGEVDSDGYFPETAHHKKMPRAGEIKESKYPDTEEMIHRDQQAFVSKTSKSMPKPEFRH